MQQLTYFNRQCYVILNLLTFRPIPEQMQQLTYCNASVTSYLTLLTFRPTPEQIQQLTYCNRQCYVILKTPDVQADSGADAAADVL
jgi:hypothetical protein